MDNTNQLRRFTEINHKWVRKIKRANRNEVSALCQQVLILNWDQESTATNPSAFPVVAFIETAQKAINFTANANDEASDQNRVALCQSVNLQSHFIIVQYALKEKSSTFSVVPYPAIMRPSSSPSVSFSFNRCYNCDQYSNTKKCSKCKQAKYCSLKCQKQHWSIHKKVCTKSTP